MKTTLCLVGLVTALTGVAAPAAAHGNRETVSVHVSYDDLNLASRKGQQVLERRLRQAAEDVCGYRDQTSGTRIRSQKVVECYRSARNAAMQRYAAIMQERQLGG